MSEQGNLFEDEPFEDELFSRAKPMTHEQHELLKRAGRRFNRKYGKARWYNVGFDLTRDDDGVDERIGQFRYWLHRPYRPGVPMRVIEIYCQNDDCLIRTINLVTKDFGGRSLPKEFLCPACRAPARVMWNVSDEEFRKQRVSMFDILDYEEEPDAERGELDLSLKPHEQPRKKGV
jgi:hypothetical protein